MKRELQDVLAEVRKQMQYTVLNYPERDPKGLKWGSPSYNGNCSGKVPLGFIDKLGAKSVFEMYAGSGTLSDVCRDYEIPYCGVDLNPNPVRDNIYTMDICDMEQDFPMDIHSADFIFQHPPYPGIKRIQYAGSAWKDTTGVKNRDIQTMNFEEGMKKVNLATMRAYSAMQPGAYMAILVGEIRADGKYYSMFQNLALPGEIFQTYVKLQNNTWSDRQSYTYNKNPRALTGHEMIALIKKPSGYNIMYIMPKAYVMDIRDSATATWEDVVLTVMREIKKGTTTEIYSEVEGHKKCKNNPNWQAKVRQILQQLENKGKTLHIKRGVWAVAA